MVCSVFFSSSVFLLFAKGIFFVLALLLLHIYWFILGKVLSYSLSFGYMSSYSLYTMTWWFLKCSWLAIVWASPMSRTCIATSMVAMVTKVDSSILEEMYYKIIKLKRIEN